VTDVEPGLRSDDGAALDRLARSMTTPGHDVPDYRLVGSRHHRSSVNLLVDLAGAGAEFADGPADGGDGGRRLFVKRFREHASTRYRAAQDGLDRPRLRPVTDPASRLADEAAALNAIHRMVADADRNDWFAVAVIPAADCPDLLVLERIDVPTMAERIESGAPDVMMDGAARSLGAWLQAFHRQPPAHPRARPHLTRSADLVRLATEMIDHIDDRRLERRRDRIIGAVASLPPEFEVTPSHGDLNPKNVFVADDGVIAVFDTAAESAMPVHVDLANLAVTLEFAGYKQPLARTRVRAEQLAEQFRVGYGSAIPARSELLAFEIVVLLDRWCSLGERGGRSSLKRAAVQHLRRQILAAGLSAGIGRRLDQLGAV